MRTAVLRSRLLALLCCAALAFSGAACARKPASALAPADEQSSVALSRLPQRAQAVYGLILAGGPFAFDKDGAVFANREGLLPTQTRGYYREYTVAAARARSRGARRIVCGGAQARRPVVCYYSADHYASFQRIAP